MPDLIPWLDHEQFELNYIAKYALDEATGIDGYSFSGDEVEIIKEIGIHAHAVSKYENWLAEKRRAEAPEEQ